MKAMILAAGRGSRMRELTDNTPKPLLKVGDKTLIDHQIEALVRAGFQHIVINTGYLGEQIIAHCGAGKRYHPQLTIDFSIEPQSAFDTGGGVKKALSLLGDKPFLLTNADIFTDFDYQNLRDVKFDSAHLVLVANPEFKDKGDFALQDNLLSNDSELTFSGISLIHPKILAEQEHGTYSIVPILRQLIDAQKVSGELYQGLWLDVGTPERLQTANQVYQTRQKSEHSHG